MYIGNWQIDDFITWMIDRHDRAGRASSETVSVTYRIYEDEIAAQLVSGSMTQFDVGNTSGLYSERIQLTAALGFERGKHYTIYVEAPFGDFEVVTLRWFQIGANATEVVLKGTVDDTVAPTTTVFEADDITEATANHFKDRVIIFKSGVLKDAAKAITAYALVAGRGRFTTGAFTDAPGNNDEFLIV